MNLDRIGIWSEIKLAVLQEYASAFTRLLKAKSWCRGCCYVDAFAGAGVHVSKATGEMVAGSPVNALLVTPPFDRIVLIDVDAEKVDSLTELCGHDKRVEIFPGDCNEVLSGRVAPLLAYSSYWRGLCVLDPYGIHGKTLKWQTIRQLSDLNTVDVFLNFPVMDINRNTLRRCLRDSSPANIMAFKEFWGGEEWVDKMYQPNLFGDLDKVGTNRTLAALFQSRLREVAGFQFVPDPILMKNTTGGELYFLFFASHQPVAQKIVEDIFRKYGGGQ